MVIQKHVFARWISNFLANFLSCDLLFGFFSSSGIRGVSHQSPSNKWGSVEGMKIIALWRRKVGSGEILWKQVTTRKIRKGLKRKSVLHKAHTQKDTIYCDHKEIMRSTVTTQKDTVYCDHKERMWSAVTTKKAYFVFTDSYSYFCETVSYRIPTSSVCAVATHHYTLPQCQKTRHLPV